MGLGKTLQIISLCVGMYYAKKSEPILIIVPCTLQRQVGFKNLFWKIEEFASRINFEIIKSGFKNSNCGGLY